MSELWIETKMSILSHILTPQWQPSMKIYECQLHIRILSWRNGTSKFHHPVVYNFSGFLIFDLMTKIDLFDKPLQVYFIRICTKS